MSARTSSTTADLAAFRVEAERWLAERRPPADDGRLRPDRDVAVFHSLPHDAEAELVRAAAAWQAEKYDAGYGALRWPEDLGGAGLTAEHDRIFAEVERRFDIPADHELRRITTNLVAPTLRDHGTSQLKERHLQDFLSCRTLVCQLFSEPNAGSDLAGVATKARREGDTWILDGAKVWVSGAQFADFGLLLARSDPQRPKHAGLTAFLLPMSAPGVEIRPIRQMSGGCSFNEIFFNDVEVADDLRIGEVGQGWTVALAMLTFERSQSGAKAGVGGSWEQLRALAADRQQLVDPVARDQLVQAYVGERVLILTRQRADAARQRGDAPGPEGSLGKLLWSQNLARVGRAAAMLAGPDLTAEVDEAGPYYWGSHVLGAPGFRIAGGSDEIQRTIIGERLLGLPKEPAPDAGRDWRDRRR